MSRWVGHLCRLAQELGQTGGGAGEDPRLLEQAVAHKASLHDFIVAIARELGLELVALHPRPDVLAAFRAAFPAPSAASDLALWDRFELRHPEIFREMIFFSCRRP